MDLNSPCTTSYALEGPRNKRLVTKHILLRPRPGLRLPNAHCLTAAPGASEALEALISRIATTRTPRK